MKIMPKELLELEKFRFSQIKICKDYRDKQEILTRMNPFRAFSFSDKTWFPLKHILKFLYREYNQNNSELDYIQFTKCLMDNRSISTWNKGRFLRSLSELDYRFKLELISLYETHDTRSIAGILGVNQRLIHRIMKSLEIEMPKLNKVSKVQTRILNYIESKIPYNILREVRFNKYVVDGYVEELNLIIEVYGNWCHSKRVEKDNKKTEYLSNKGFDVVVIDSLSAKEYLDDLIETTIIKHI